MGGVQARSVRVAAAGLASGVACALAVLAFSACADWLREGLSTWNFVVWLLPIAGLASLALYRALGVPFGMGTRAALAAVAQDEPAGDGPAGKDRAAVPLALAPAVFCAACLTLACGGSVGKEAVALQIAVALSCALSGLFGLRGARERRFAVLCGLAAAMGILLGTPLAAAVFAFELLHPRGLGRARTTALTWWRRVLVVLLAAAAALIAVLVAQTASAESLACALAVPAPGAGSIARAAAVALAGAAVGALFSVLSVRGRAAVDGLGRPAAWIVAGGLVFAAVVWFTGCFEVCGTGVSQIKLALAGQVDTPLFAAKFVLTLVLLACGFKGGEIMPVLCIGSTLGCFAGVLLDGDAAFLAAVGMVATFAAATNCPLAAALIGVESFGLAGAPWYLVAAVVAYTLTSRVSLYENVRRPRSKGAHARRGRA